MTDSGSQKWDESYTNIWSLIDMGTYGYIISATQSTLASCSLRERYIYGLKGKCYSSFLQLSISSSCLQLWVMGLLLNRRTSRSVKHWHWPSIVELNFMCFLLNLWLHCLEVLSFPNKISGSHFYIFLSAISCLSQSPVHSFIKLTEKFFLVSVSTVATIDQAIVSTMKENLVISLFQILFMHESLDTVMSS